MTFTHELGSPHKVHWLRRSWWKVSNKIDDFLTDNGIYFHWKIRNALYYIKSRIRQTHMIDTKLEKGHWIDKVSLMEAGLLELVDSFVSRDGEDAFSAVLWEGCDEHEEMKAKIIEILYWKNIRKDQLEAEKDALWDVYHKKYPIFFKEIDAAECAEKGIPEGSKEMTHKDVEDEIDENFRKVDLERILMEERLIERETQRILHLCVDVRNFLWT